MNAKEHMLEKAIEAKLIANSQLGYGDPFPYDTKAAAYADAFLELGGTQEELAAEWRKIYNSTSWSSGGGAQW